MHVASLTVASMVPLKAIDEALRMLNMGFVSLLELYSHEHPVTQRTYKLRTTRKNWVQAITQIELGDRDEDLLAVKQVRLRLWKTDRKGEQLCVDGFTSVFDFTFGFDELSGELRLESFADSNINFRIKAEEQCRP